MEPNRLHIYFWPCSKDYEILDGVNGCSTLLLNSLLPLLKGEKPENWRNSIYYHYYEYPSVHMVPRHYGIRTHRYKLIHLRRQKGQLEQLRATYQLGAGLWFNLSPRAQITERIE